MKTWIQSQHKETSCPNAGKTEAGGPLGPERPPCSGRSSNYWVPGHVKDSSQKARWSAPAVWCLRHTYTQIHMRAHTQKHHTHTPINNFIFGLQKFLCIFFRMRFLLGKIFWNGSQINFSLNIFGNVITACMSVKIFVLNFHHLRVDGLKSITTNLFQW